MSSTPHQDTAEHGLPAHKPVRQYKYHDRGDAVYTAVRKKDAQPHLVVTGKCAPCYDHLAAGPA